VAAARKGPPGRLATVPRRPWRGGRGRALLLGALVPEQHAAGGPARQGGALRLNRAESAAAAQGDAAITCGLFGPGPPVARPIPVQWRPLSRRNGPVS
jgi:hypothetical protein